MLIRNSTILVSLEDIITPESVARGIKETKWPGRLSFHTVHLPTSPSTPNEALLLVLADGAHNPASVQTLGSYITYLLDRTIVSTIEEGPNYQARRKLICINFTYILPPLPLSSKNALTDFVSFHRAFPFPLSSWMVSRSPSQWLFLSVYSVLHLLKACHGLNAYLPPK